MFEIFPIPSLACPNFKEGWILIWLVFARQDVMRHTEIDSSPYHLQIPYISVSH